MGRGPVRGERRHGGRLDSAQARGRKGDGAARRRQNCRNRSTRGVGDAVERTAAGDREDGSGGGRRTAWSRRWTTSTGIRGRARTGLELWPADRAQLAVQGIVLRENGYRCEEGVVYYRKTGQRVRVAFDEALIAETEALIAEAWRLARSGRDSGAAGGFAEVSGVLAGGDLPAGRDVAGGRGGRAGAAATGAVRRCRGGSR